MPRKLKTYTTSVGFFDLAVAAPSMKAALDAWGMRRNAFHQGFAEETDDPKIIAAATAKPGVVLRRGVGTNAEFSEHAELPTALPALTPFRAEKRRNKSNAKHKARKREPDASSPKDAAAIISFKKAKAKRERERAKEEAAQQRERNRRREASDKARDAFQRASVEHERVLREIEHGREVVDRRAEKEQKRWNNQRRKLESAMRGDLE
jgi:hypothetical protein